MVCLNPAYTAESAEVTESEERQLQQKMDTLLPTGYKPEDEAQKIEALFSKDPVPEEVASSRVK